MAVLRVLQQFCTSREAGAVHPRLTLQIAKGEFVYYPAALIALIQEVLVGGACLAAAHQHRHSFVLEQNVAHGTGEKQRHRQQHVFNW